MNVFKQGQAPRPSVSQAASQWQAIVSHEAIMKAKEEYQQLSIQPFYCNMVMFEFSFKWTKPNLWSKAFAVNNVFLEENRNTVWIKFGQKILSKIAATNFIIVVGIARIL